MSRSDELNKILRGLQSGTPEIQASALVSEDGLMIASALPAHLDETRVAGIGSTLLRLGQRAATDLHRGKLEQVLVRGQEGYVVMVAAAPGTMLLALASHEAKLGLIFLDLTKAAKDLSKVI